MLNVIYIYDMTYVVILLIFGCQSSSTKDVMGEHLHHQLAPHVPGGHEADDGDEWAPWELLGFSFNLLGAPLFFLYKIALG